MPPTQVSGFPANNTRPPPYSQPNQMDGTTLDNGLSPSRDSVGTFNAISRVDQTRMYAYSAYRSIAALANRKKGKIKYCGSESLASAHLHSQTKILEDCKSHL